MLAWEAATKYRLVENIVMRIQLLKTLTLSREPRKQYAFWKTNWYYQINILFEKKLVKSK